MADRLIRVSAVVLRDGTGAVLTVRKRGTDRFMFPGGKPEVGESPVATAIRECAEEVGIELQPAHLDDLGVFRASAANEAGFDVEAAVFVASTPVSEPETIHPTGEIAELRWQRLDEPLPPDLAPLLSEHVLPALARVGR